MTDDPLDLFTRWFEEAREQGAFEPQAVALATATPDGVPSARMVLMKGFDERGLTFFTNYASRKGDELEANPRAAPWSSTGPRSGARCGSRDPSRAWTDPRPRRTRAAASAPAS